MSASSASPPRILIAGVGNIFLGDDAFGVEAVARLANRGLPPNVTVADFGIRGFDLACTLIEGYDAAILIDAAPRGGQPGTLYVTEPDIPTAADRPGTAQGGAVSFDVHNMDPVRVLQFAATLGRLPRCMYVIGCEPMPLGMADESDRQASLSVPVAAALEEAVTMVQTLVNNISRGDLEAANSR